MTTSDGGSQRAWAEGSGLLRHTMAKEGTEADVFTKVTKDLAERVGKTFGHEMHVLVEQQKETTLEPPKPMKEMPSKMEELMWSKNYNVHLKKKVKYEEDKTKCLALF